MSVEISIEEMEENIESRSTECQARLHDLPQALSLKKLLTGDLSLEEVSEQIKERCASDHFVYGKECEKRVDGKCCLDLSEVVSENIPTN